MFETIKDASVISLNNKDILKVPTVLSLADKLGGCKARWGWQRMYYAIKPGLYAVGEPGGDSPVLATANYKLSFDALRKELTGMDAWILVLDTKGINVWCAAGKGTFGTDELIKRIKHADLEKIVNHKKVIVPQLGAVGVAAHVVKKQIGFSVTYGPVRARDIKEFLTAGCKATDEMRRIQFTIYDRLVLTPMEAVIGAKYLLLLIASFIILAGFHSKGYSSHLATLNGFRAAKILFLTFLAGTVVGPLLLPWLPFRSFAAKGAVLGLALAAALAPTALTGPGLEAASWVLFITAITSFCTMNFTGTSTYTSLSGVKKEMAIAVPLQLIASVIAAVLWIAARFI